MAKFTAWSGKGKAGPSRGDPKQQRRRPQANVKLTRSSQDRILAGVCGGLARHLGWSPFRVRLVYVLVSILSAAFPGILVYLLLWFLMPRDDQD